MKIQKLTTRHLLLISIFYFCLYVPLPAQLELFPETVRFDSLTTYIGIRRVDGVLFPYNNLVLRNNYRISNEEGTLGQSGNIEFDTKGGVIFQINGDVIGAFSKYGLLLESNVKIIRGNSGLRDLLPFAYGKINASGTSNVGTLNFTVTQPEIGIYDIVFPGANVNNLVIHVTPIANNEAQSNIGVQAIVSIKNTTTMTVRTKVLNTLNSRTFNFIAYKP